MPSSTVDQHLGEWLEPATLETSPEQHAQLRKAVSAMSKVLDTAKCMRLIAAAHAEVSDEARTWMTERVREQDPSFTGTGKDRLLAIIAGAVIIETLETTAHSQRTLAALLVDSARCTYPSPAVAVVRTTAERVGNELRRAVRTRSVDQKSVSKEIAEQLGAVATLDPAAPDLAVAVGVIAAQESMLKKIAERLDEANKRMMDALCLQDEELDTLWWSYGDLSTTLGARWGSVQPVERRAVLASIELRRLVTRTPSPLSSRALLSRVLGDVADSETTLGAIAGCAIDSLDALAGLPDDRLLPMVSVARARQRLGDGDDTWKTVVSRTLNFDVDTKISLLDGAEQILRELDIKASF